MKINSNKKNKSNNDFSIENEEKINVNINGKKERHPSKGDKTLKIKLCNIDGNREVVQDDFPDLEEDIFSDKSFRKIKKIKKNTNVQQRFEDPPERPPKMEEEIFVEEYS